MSQIRSAENVTLCKLPYMQHNIRSVWRGVSNCSSCSVNHVSVPVCHTASLSDRILSGCVELVKNDISIHACGLYLQAHIYAWLTVYTTTSVSDGFNPKYRMECAWESHTPLHTLLIIYTRDFAILFFWSDKKLHMFDAHKYSSDTDVRKNDIPYSG